MQGCVTRKKRDPRHSGCNNQQLRKTQDLRHPAAINPSARENGPARKGRIHVSHRQAARLPLRPSSYSDSCAPCDGPVAADAHAQTSVQITTSWSPATTRSSAPPPRRPCPTRPTTASMSRSPASWSGWNRRATTPARSTSPSHQAPGIHSFLPRKECPYSTSRRSTRPARLSART